MGSSQRDSRPLPHDGAGHAALALGLVAVIATFVPVIGELVVIPVAIGAAVAGFVGFDRVEHGRATNRGDALVGGGLGVIMLLINVAVLAAVHGGE